MLVVFFCFVFLWGWGFIFLIFVVISFGVCCNTICHPNTVFFPGDKLCSHALCSHCIFFVCFVFLSLNISNVMCVGDQICICMVWLPSSRVLHTEIKVPASPWLPPEGTFISVCSILKGSLILTLLDLSAAFNTIDHILLTHLKNTFIFVLFWNHNNINTQMNLIIFSFLIMAMLILFLFVLSPFFPSFLFYFNFFNFHIKPTNNNGKINTCICHTVTIKYVSS